jgi:hypothetical protein
MKKGNEPALPQEYDNPRGMNGTVLGVGQLKGGLTKREYFACLAMQGMIAGSQGLNITIEQFAKQSTLLADALLLELSKEQGE